MDTTPNTEQANTKETAVQQKLAAMFAANDDKITIPKIYIDMVNDIEAAAVLDEIMFWTLPKKGTGKTSLRVRKDGKLWLAVRRADWWERKRLTERQSDRAIEKLVTAGMVEKHVWNFNGKPTVHLRLIMAKFIEAYANHLKKTIETDEPELLQDIADLYAMMGFPPSPNGNYQTVRDPYQMVRLPHQTVKLLTASTQPPQQPSAEKIRRPPGGWNGRLEQGWKRFNCPLLKRNRPPVCQMPWTCFHRNTRNLFGRS